MDRAVLSLLAFALVGAPASVAAQSGGLASGDRVRVTAAARGAQEYSLVAVRGDTLQVRRSGAGADELIPLQTVERLEVRRAAPPRGETVVRRMMYGVAIGAVAGGVLLTVTDDDQFFADSRGGSAVIGAAAGGVVGGGVGLIAGLVGERDRWENVRLR
jgi:hypothetical protein